LKDNTEEKIKREVINSLIADSSCFHRLFALEQNKVNQVLLQMNIFTTMELVFNPKLKAETNRLLRQLSIRLLRSIGSPVQKVLLNVLIDHGINKNCVGE
jgi:hypothetical protein